jgi:hypothetical protein
MNTTECLTVRTPSNARSNLFRELMDSAAKLYCRLFHDAISRPVAGKYRCWKCLKEFELDW